MEKLELTPDEWQRVERLSQELARDVDRNEFGKVVSYLHRTHDPQRFMKLLHRLPNSPFIRSNRTQYYFERIAQVCSQYLLDLDPARQLLVAFWAFRLMTYYQIEQVRDWGRKH